jgi:hypothetical protein
MRRVLLCAAALAAFGASVSIAQAETIYPWCSYYGGDKMGARNCGFTTWEQCQANVSGIGGFCDRNPYYVEAKKPQRRERR